MSSKSKPVNSPLSNLFYKISKICALGHESLSVDDLFEKTLQALLDLFKAKRGAVFLVNPQTRELVLKQAKGLTPDEQNHIMECLKNRMIAPLEKLRQPSLVAATENYKSFICSPMIMQDQLVGIISVSDKCSDKNFMPRELQLLEFLSSQIAFNYQRISMAQQIESQERFVSLGKLAGGIAHEFNNPLDGVMRYTNLCMGHVQDDEVLREYLTEIQQGLKRMANIVRNLLACARNSPKTVLKIDVNKTIEQSLKELNPYLASKNITLVKNYAKQLPEITDLGFERIVSNLLRNAVDAIQKKGTIGIVTSLEEEFIKIEVSDSGQGISEDDLNRIFEPFYTTKDIDKGCGLGLTIVNEIVKYYDGKIKVKSRPNEGTTFTVKLPVK